MNLSLIRCPDLARACAATHSEDDPAEIYAEKTMFEILDQGVVGAMWYLVYVMCKASKFHGDDQAYQFI